MISDSRAVPCIKRTGTSIISIKLNDLSFDHIPVKAPSLAWARRNPPRPLTHLLEVPRILTPLELAGSQRSREIEQLQETLQR
jgi:hypothetical protein